MTTTVIKAVWKYDQRGLDECAESTAEMLKNLKDYDSSISGLRYRGKIKAASIELANLTPQSVREKFLASADGFVDDENASFSGYHVGFWMPDGPFNSIDAIVGSKGSTLSNSVTLKCPRESPYSLSSGNTAKVIELCNTLLDITPGEFCVWGTNAVFAPQIKSRKYPYFGFATVLEEDILEESNVLIGEEFTLEHIGRRLAIVPAISPHEIDNRAIYSMHA